MAWSETARKAAAEARRRRATQAPKGKTGDWAARAKLFNRQSMAAGIRQARAVNAGKAKTPARINTFAPAFTRGFFSTLKK